MVYTRSPDYLYRRNGIYYFTRNVPSDLKARFNKSRVVVSLHTRSIVKAQKSALALCDRLDRYFESLRLERFHSQELGLKFSGAIDVAPNEVHSSISDALELYIRLKGAGRDHVFAKTSARNVGYLIESIGDIDLSSIKPVNAGQFRDHLIARGLASTSIRRVLSSVKAIYNLASKELGIANPNPFAGIFIPEDNAGSERLPVPLHSICLIQGECLRVNDPKRWLIAIISDTGMRLSEAAGLLTNDIKFDADVPHITLRKHPWRSLKTASSERDIPLVGSAYDAARSVLEQGQKFAFSKYCNEVRCNANSASAALNKWLRPSSIICPRCGIVPMKMTTLKRRDW